MNNSALWINKAIEEVAETAVKDGEYWRGTYTEQDRKAVALLKKYMEDAGFRTYFDAVGNLFGRIEGRNPEIIMSGSHRDTVKHGGKYDGMLGVLSAIRAAGDLYREFGTPEYTVETVAICEEESSRFPTSFLGSRNICGRFNESELADVDETGITLECAMKTAGYLNHPIAKKEKI